MIATLINFVAGKPDAHSDYITSVAFSLDGTKIVSGSADGTIKVWDSGAPKPSKSPLLGHKTDVCWLAWQSSWSSCARRRTPTAAGTSRRWRFPRTGPRSCLDRTTGRSKSGILVRRSPRIAPPWPLPTLVGLPGRQTGAVEREDGHTQRQHLVCGVFLGRDQDRVGIERQDDQSLGFWCAGALKIAPPFGTN